MTKWLRKIAAMAQEIPESFKFSLSNLAEKEEVEEEKGKLSKETTALLRVLQWLKMKAAEEGKAHQKVCRMCGQKECEEFLRKISAISNDIDAIRVLLFASIREELNLNPSDFPSIGIRKDGTVVEIPPEDKEIEIIHIGMSGPPPDLEGILAGFGGRKPH